MTSFVFLLLIGASTRMCQSSVCSAQCNYDHMSGRADCSSRNLDCIPVNYPDSLVMDLSHNNISVLESGDFDGNNRFNRLVELHLDYNNIADVTSLLTSTALGSLKKLSLKHNVISSLSCSCELGSVEDISMDYNRFKHLYVFPNCQKLRYFSVDSNGLQVVYMFRRIYDFSSLFFSLRFNQIQTVNILSITLNSNCSKLIVMLDHNKIRSINSYTVPTKLTLRNNKIHGWNSGFSFSQPGDKVIERLDIGNNLFDSLIQPDWAESLQILYADDNMLANLSSTTLRGFVSLTELHLANNRLLFVSPNSLSQLTMLRSLYLDGNALTSLSGGIFLNQAKLIQLSITNNQLSVLHADYFIGLDSLELLYLAGNRLFYVHSGMFRHIPRLIRVDLSQNELDVYDTTNCSCHTSLQKVLLAHNLLRDISNLLGHCTSLTRLDVSFNQIQMVPVNSTGALSRLELEGNPLQCDCRLTGLRDWLLNNPPSVLPRCQGPPRYSGAVVTDLDMHDFSCAPPKATIKENHLTVAVDQTATLSCTATGIPAPNITWLDPKGTIISDEGQDRFVISSDTTVFIFSVERSDQGMYTCLVQNTLGEMDRAEIILTVTEPKSTGIAGTLVTAVVITMFVTLVVTLSVITLVIYLCRLCDKKAQPARPAASVDASVAFHNREAAETDRAYVNETVEDHDVLSDHEQDVVDGYDTALDTEHPMEYAEAYEAVTVGAMAW